MFDVCVCFVLCKFVSGLIFFVVVENLWFSDVCAEEIASDSCSHRQSQSLWSVQADVQIVYLQTCVPVSYTHLTLPTTAEV